MTKTRKSDQFGGTLVPLGNFLLNCDHESDFNSPSTVEALVSDHLGNSEKWSQLELVTYEDGLS